MSDRYPVSVGAEMTRGTFFRIERRIPDRHQRLPRPGLSLVFEGQRNVLRLAEGDFATTVCADGNTQVSPGCRREQPAV